MSGFWAPLVVRSYYPYISIQLMVQKKTANHLGCIPNLVNNGINYQPQPVFSPDSLHPYFWDWKISRQKPCCGPIPDSDHWADGGRWIGLEDLKGWWDGMICHDSWWLHPWKLTWHWKITIFNRKYIFKWWIFQCHVSFWECIPCYSILLDRRCSYCSSCLMVQKSGDHQLRSRLVVYPIILQGFIYARWFGISEPSTVWMMVSGSTQAPTAFPDLWTCFSGDWL